MSPKLITVYGATGNQGSSVVNSLLENKSGDYKVRGLTRDTDSDKAKALAARGVEVVQADGYDEQQMRKAFNGSWAVFLNTYSDSSAANKRSGATESDYGKELVDIAFESGVEVLVYSGLASPKVITHGAILSPEMDEKHEIVEYGKKRGFKSFITVAPGWFLENHFNSWFAKLLGGFPYTADEEGYYTLTMPSWGAENKAPFISIADDYGDIVHGVLLSPEAYNGHFIQAISDLATPNQLVAAVEKETGKKSRYVEMKDWKSFGTSPANEPDTLRGMFGICHYEGGHYFGAKSDTFEAKKLKAAAVMARGQSADRNGLMTVDEYVTKVYSS